MNTKVKGPEHAQMEFSAVMLRPTESPQESSEWRVLLADDDVTVLRLLSTMVEGVTIDGAPVTVVQCTTPAKAREALEEGRFAVCLLDVYFGDEPEGLSLINDIRADPRHDTMQVVLMSARSDLVEPSRTLEGYYIQDFWDKATLQRDTIMRRMCGLVRGFAIAERFRAFKGHVDVLSAAPSIGLLRVNAEGACRQWSPSFGRLIGTPPLVGQDCNLLFDAEHAKALDMTIDWVKRTTCPARVTVRAAGRSLELHVGNCPESDDIVIAAIDRTDEAELRTELEGARRDAAERVAPLAHDLNNLIGVLYSTIDMLGVGDRLTDPAFASQALSGVCDRASAIVARLRNASTNEPKFCEPGVVIATERSVFQLIVGADAPLTVECEDRAGRVRFSELDLTRIVTNLLVNARRACGDAGSYSVRVAKLESEGVDWVKIEVSDDGPGMPPELCARIFERGVSGPESKGDGLGLWSVRRMVEAAGGVIWVESAPGEGATFEIRLPVVDVDTAELRPL